MEKINFTLIPISEELKRAIADIGYNMATAIQSQAIPLILEGHDIIGRSETGSGKTAAFGLPAIDIIDTAIDNKKVQVLILCPTRELAIQASNEIRNFLKYKEGINVVPIYGGDPISNQIMRLKRGCQIVVGTPGRIMDHMRRKTLKFSDVKMVVLDEADEMLNMGFVEDIETILTGIPEDHQTVLFSATMPAPVLKITKRFQKDPKMVEIKQSQMTVSTVEQLYFDVPRAEKNAALYSLLEFYKPQSAIVFCNTKRMVDELIEELNSNGYQSQGLHGDMRQATRMQVMRQFKEGKFSILVATDIAARGIDVNDVKIVFNYDLPQEDEHYVHRIGRTGRAGKSGQAITLIQGSKQRMQLRNLMKYTKCEITRKPLPTKAQIKSLKADDLSKKVLSFMAENDYSSYVSKIEELSGEKYTATDIAAALFKMSLKQKLISEGKTTVLETNDVNNYDVGDKPYKARVTRTRQKYDDTPLKRDRNNITTIRASIGKKDNVSPNHILGAMVSETGLPGNLFGKIRIEDTFSTIEVPNEYKASIIQSLNGKKIKGKIVTVF